MLAEKLYTGQIFYSPRIFNPHNYLEITASHFRRIAATLPLLGANVRDKVLILFTSRIFNNYKQIKETKIQFKVLYLVLKSRDRNEISKFIISSHNRPD